MAYTPTLTDKQSCTLRRIAWASGRPMTRTLADILDRIVSEIDSSVVCSECKDKSRCAQCAFTRN